MKKNIPITNKLKETSTGILTCNLYQKAYIFRRQKYKNRYGKILTDLNFSQGFLRHNFTKARKGFSIAVQLYQFKQGKGWNNVRASVLVDSINYTHIETLKILNKVLACIESIRLQNESSTLDSNLLVLSPEKGGFICLFIGLVGFLPWDSLPFAFANFLAKKFTMLSVLSALAVRKSILGENCLIRIPFDEIEITIQQNIEKPNYKKQYEPRYKEFDNAGLSLAVDSGLRDYEESSLEKSYTYDNVIEELDENFNTPGTTFGDGTTTSSMVRSVKFKSEETISTFGSTDTFLGEIGRYSKKDFHQDRLGVQSRAMIKNTLGDPFSFSIDSFDEPESFSPLFIIIFSKTPIITPDMEVEFR